MAKDGHWCSLEEAARQTGVSEAEVKSLAYRGELFTAIYSPKKRYLVFSHADSGGITGHATCEYFGPLAVLKPIIHKLLGGESANLNGQRSRPLDARGLSDWQGTCPFTSEEAGNLVGWRALDMPESFGKSLFMTPMPKEQYGRAYFRKIADSRPSDFEGNEITALVDKLVDKVYPNDYSLNYWENGAVAPDALIVYVPVKAEGVEQVEDSGGEIDQRFKFFQPGKRADDMAWLLWRVIQSHPKLSAKAIWNLLKDEIETAEPIYDIDCILREVRGDTIHWYSIKGAAKTLEFRAFENRLSRLRTSNTAEKGL